MIFFCLYAVHKIDHYCLKVCASKSVYLYKSLYSLKVYRFTCAHFNHGILTCCLKIRNEEI